MRISILLLLFFGLLNPVWASPSGRDLPIYILVHGGGPSWIVGLKKVQKELLARGVSKDRIFLPTYDYRKSLDQINRELKDKLRPIFDVGAKVRIITHSLGDFIALRAVLELGVTSSIDWFVSLGGVAHGQDKTSSLCQIGLCPDYMKELTPANNLRITDLWAFHSTDLKSIRHCAIYSNDDERVQDPRDSSVFAHSVVVLVNGYSHWELVSSGETLPLIENGCTNKWRTSLEKAQSRFLGPSLKPANYFSRRSVEVRRPSQLRRDLASSPEWNPWNGYDFKKLVAPIYFPSLGVYNPSTNRPPIVFGSETEVSRTPSFSTPDFTGLQVHTPELSGSNRSGRSLSSSGGQPGNGMRPSGRGMKPDNGAPTPLRAEERDRVVDADPSAPTSLSGPNQPASTDGSTFGDVSQGGLNTSPFESVNNGAKDGEEPTTFRLAFRFQNSEGLHENLCGGTPAGKKTMGDRCGYAIFLAAHCVDQDFSSMRLQKMGSEFYHSFPNSSLVIDRATAGVDAALIHFEASCDLIADGDIAKIAPLDEYGRPRLPAGGELKLRNQEGSLITGKINHGIKHPNPNDVIADEVEGPHSRGGDSGSPIWSPEGLVGALRGGSQERLDFSFSSGGVGWLAQTLARRGFESPMKSSSPITAPGIARYQEPFRGESLPVTAAPVSNGVPRRSIELPPLVHGAVGKCVSCHNLPQNKDQLAPGLKDVQTIGSHLAAMNDTVLETMLERSHLSSEQASAVRQFVHDARSPLLATSSRAIASTVPACYTSAEEQSRKTRELPQVDAGSSQMASRLNDAIFGGRLMFYDKSSVPRTWQQAVATGQSRQRFLTANKTPNPDMYRRMGYHSNAGLEHPWVNPAGMDLATNGSSDKFVIPPARGPMIQMVNRTRASHPHYFGLSRNVNGPQLGYEFQPGTMFGEVLRVGGLPFEIRLRTKDNQGGWLTDVLRPFESAKDLANQLRSLCDAAAAPPGCNQVKASNLVSQIESASTRSTSRRTYLNRTSLRTALDPLLINRTAGGATQETAALQNLPDFPNDVRQALLAKGTFRSVFNKPWATGAAENAHGWAPTASGDSSVVPQNFFGGFVGLNQASCMKCHETAGRHVDNFEPDARVFFRHAPGDTPRPRTWYDFVPGDDGILSFHPYSAAAVQQNAYTSNASLNPCLVQNQLVR